MSTKKYELIEGRLELDYRVVPNERFPEHNDYKVVAVDKISGFEEQICYIYGPNGAQLARRIYRSITRHYSQSWHRRFQRMVERLFPDHIDRKVQEWQNAS